MIKAFDTMLLPGSFHSRRGIEISLSCIVGHKTDIKDPFVIAQTGGPHTLAVAIGLPFQRLPGRTVQPVIDIDYMLPVHKIIRTQYLTTRHKMHGCAHHIIGIPNSDDIRVRIVQSGNRICYSNHILIPVPLSALH